MNDLEKSDKMMCNTKANNMYKYLKENDTLFLQRMRNTQPVHVRDIGKEWSHMIDPKMYICNDVINTRGGNAVYCEADKSAAGYNNYTKYHMNEYLLVPCKENTWKNYVQCDNNKCCSVKHQMYDNQTKRR
jgi:hypothetical protein